MIQAFWWTLYNPQKLIKDIKLNITCYNEVDDEKNCERTATTAIEIELREIILFKKFLEILKVDTFFLNFTSKVNKTKYESNRNSSRKVLLLHNEINKAWQLSY